MNIRIHIERLILEGLPANGLHSGLIGQAVEAELARLLGAANTTSIVSRHEAYSPPAHLALVRPNDSTSVGTQIGGAVYQVLNPMPSSQTAKNVHHVCHSCR